MAPQSRKDEPPERFEPMPSVVALPGWLWRRAGRRARIALGLIAIAVIGVAIYLAPRIADEKRDDQARREQEAVSARAAERRRIIAVQRPRRKRTVRSDVRTDVRGRRLAARSAIVAELGDAVLADARERSSKPVKRAACRPATTDNSRPAPETVLGRRYGVYGCTAITSDIAKLENTSAKGYVGFPYLARIDFSRGSLTFCQVSAIAGEGSYYRDDKAVAVAKACGG